MACWNPDRESARRHPGVFQRVVGLVAVAVPCLCLGPDPEPGLAAVPVVLAGPVFLVVALADLAVDRSAPVVLVVVPVPAGLVALFAPVAGRSELAGLADSGRFAAG